MAKTKAKAKTTKTTKAKATKATKATKAPATESAKYGIKDLAETMGLKEASVRVKLRSAGVAKAGKAYGWNSKSDLEAVAKQLAPKEDKKAA